MWYTESIAYEIQCIEENANSKMPAVEHSPSIPAESQQETEEEAKEEAKDGEETVYDMIFPMNIEKDDTGLEDDSEAWHLRARTSERKKTPIGIYTNKEETRKKGGERKTNRKKHIVDLLMLLRQWKWLLSLNCT